MKSSYKKILTFIGLSLLALIYIGQGCAAHKSNFAYDASLDQRGKYNLGAGGEGYTCVPGKRLGIWLDPDLSGQQLDKNYIGFIVSYNGKDKAAVNYNYFSASAHPKVSPTPTGFQTNVWGKSADGRHLAAKSWHDWR